MQHEGWMILTRRLTAFFAALAVLNEVIWRNFSTATWVGFKTFGLTAAVFLFFMAQGRLFERLRGRRRVSRRAVGRSSCVASPARFPHNRGQRPTAGGRRDAWLEALYGVTASNVWSGHHTDKAPDPGAVGRCPAAFGLVPGRVP